MSAGDCDARRASREPRQVARATRLTAEQAEMLIDLAESWNEHRRTELGLDPLTLDEVLTRVLTTAAAMLRKG